ncbi:alpha/beta fold hydrolase [Synechococcus sp. PCC 7336]|uniref:alpha/beta fold hydrolase n=1 Tax=Synechococcus sp. PCC 7336 TaxID=195250 RepID=UPI0003499A38|nr:alpha/beta fold hydrolase [Synechococcus sp. PCC 7336]
MTDPLKPAVYIAANRVWQWRSFQLPYLAAGDPQAEAVVLVHGFGGCIGHWRNNIAQLASQYRVYAIDLLGFGAAPKPDLDYSFELWGQQLADFCQQVVQRTATLVGNSVGAIVVSQTAAEEPTIARSVVLINCSLRLLHDRKRSQLSLVQQMGTPIVQTLLRYKPIGHFFFRQIAQRRSLRNILRRAYARPEAVTDELLDLLLAPARDPGAADVFIAFVNYSSGPLAEELLPQIHCPVAIVWGEDDPWEPLEKGRSLADFPCVREFKTIARAGHCPMDEASQEVNEYLLQWIEGLDRTATSVSV